MILCLHGHPGIDIVHMLICRQNTPTHKGKPSLLSVSINIYIFREFILKSGLEVSFGNMKIPITLPKFGHSNHERGLHSSCPIHRTAHTNSIFHVCSLCWLPALSQAGEANESEPLLSFSQSGLSVVLVSIWEFP